MRPVRATLFCIISSMISLKIKQQKALLEILERGEHTIEQALGSIIDNGAAILFLVGAHPESMSADTSEQRKKAFL